jgi:hypothetical protein
MSQQQLIEAVAAQVASVAGKQGRTVAGSFRIAGVGRVSSQICC